MVGDAVKVEIESDGTAAGTLVYLLDESTGRRTVIPGVVAASWRLSAIPGGERVAVASFELAGVRLVTRGAKLDQRSVIDMAELLTRLAYHGQEG